MSGGRGEAEQAIEIVIIIAMIDWLLERDFNKNYVLHQGKLHASQARMFAEANNPAD